MKASKTIDKTYIRTVAAANKVSEGEVVRYLKKLSLGNGVIYHHLCLRIPPSVGHRERK